MHRFHLLLSFRIVILDSRKIQKCCCCCTSHTCLFDFVSLPCRSRCTRTRNAFDHLLIGHLFENPKPRVIWLQWTVYQCQNRAKRREKTCPCPRHRKESKSKLKPIISQTDLSERKTVNDLVATQMSAQNFCGHKEQFNSLSFSFADSFQCLQVHAAHCFGHWIMFNERDQTNTFHHSLRALRPKRVSPAIKDPFFIFASHATHNEIIKIMRAQHTACLRLSLPISNLEFIRFNTCRDVTIPWHIASSDNKMNSIPNNVEWRRRQQRLHENGKKKELTATAYVSNCNCVVCHQRRVQTPIDPDTHIRT